MVARGANSGLLFLHCDQPGCRQKFFPREAASNEEQLRRRASMQGWAVTIPGSSASCDQRDTCPDHKAVP